MSEAAPGFLAEYEAALDHHLRAGDEAGLARAYELGRMALGHGFSLVDLVGVHGDALSRVTSTDGQASRTARASEFFAQAVAPFELALGGYREANEGLHALNRDLEQSNAELLKAKEAAVAAVGELDAFCYSVAHDLRAPLRRIDGWSVALTEDHAGELSAEARTVLGRMQESARFMGRLIDDLLGLSRVARAEVEREIVDLSRLARSVLSRLSEAEPRRKVDLVLKDGLTAAGDPRLLGILLDNLLGNAWKFTRLEPRARIEFGETGGTPGVFFVRDNGVGFDGAHAHKLFGVFQRLHADREFEGTGIGLVTVKRIVKRHGGRVWAEGTIGRGATVWFTLAESGPSSDDT